MAKFPAHLQPDSMACGATCLWIISMYYGKKNDLEALILDTGTNKEGATLLGISNAAERLGFRTIGAKISFDQLTSKNILPCIVHWDIEHYIVVYKIRKNKVYVSDPSFGLLVYSTNEFCQRWKSNFDTGIVLLLEPTSDFYENIESKDKMLSKKKLNKFLKSYLVPYKLLYFQLLLCLLIGSVIQLIFPFLTQSIVDVGIRNKDINAIHIILLGQLVLFISRITADIFRAWILIKISTKINVSMVSDFFTKLMKLPMSFFERKVSGDIMQRIYDNHRIEQFLTGSALKTLFSIFSFVVFSGVLAWYNLAIFAVFIVGSISYFIWTIYFLKKRENIDYKLFDLNSQNQNKVIELINGMQEIKLVGSERKKRWEWQTLQNQIFKTNQNSLTISQIQTSGSGLLNELKNIIITFLAAKLVLEGQITLGMMLSISYIIGQLNAPLMDLVTFLQQWQYARLSLERLYEIHQKENEENEEHLKELENLNTGISIEKLSFKYSDSSEFVLKNINLYIPPKKTTAIIGPSGSGKTTLLKLLLKFFTPSIGDVFIGNTNLHKISPKKWRQLCGAVMQDGFIFSDTIETNIAPGEDVINFERVQYSARMANIEDFILNLPQTYQTKIGGEGIGLSAGQKQRLLIARIIYKNPEYVFFDEATNALDTLNENIITNNINQIFKNKTIFVIAHRLSTVKNADQIIVLNNGTIVEQGTHDDLVSREGYYFNLVKNQLELEN